MKTTLTIILLTLNLGLWGQVITIGDSPNVRVIGKSTTLDSTEIGLVAYYSASYENKTDSMTFFSTSVNITSISDSNITVTNGSGFIVGNAIRFASSSTGEIHSILGIDGNILSMDKTVSASIGNTLFIARVNSMYDATENRNLANQSNTSQMPLAIWFGTDSFRLKYNGNNTHYLVENILSNNYTKAVWINANEYSTYNNIISSSESDGHVLWFPLSYCTGSGAVSYGVSAGNTSANWCSVISTQAISLNEWHHIAVTYDSATTTMKLYQNGTLIDENNAVSNPDDNNIEIGAFDEEFGFNGYMDGIRIYDSDISESIINQIYNNTMPAEGYKLNFVFDGNSITEGNFNTNGYEYPSLTDSLINMPYLTRVINLGVSGQMLSEMITDSIDVLNEFKSKYDQNILIVLGGVNDFGIQVDTTKEVIYQRLKRYCEDRKSEGWIVLAGTLLPQSVSIYQDRTNYESERQWFNTQVRTELVNYVDGIIDFASDSRIGDSGDEEDLTYYTADKIHPNDTGTQIMAEITYQAIITVLN